MPQEHYVLRCFSCETFQVHIVKKALKWECKICGVKQSLKRNYGKGSAKDCRNQVMKLNELRLKKCDVSTEAEEEFNEPLTVELREPQPAEKKTFTSKWSEYVDDDRTDGESEVDDDMMNINSKTIQKKRGGDSKKINKSRKINETKTSTDISIESNEFLDYKKELEKKGNDEKLIIHSEVTIKPGKYSKYLDEDEPPDDLLGKISKSSNIFDSDSTDLDSILNF